jgi:tetratricopeptide (TPR) repeat protein
MLVSAVAALLLAQAAGPWSTGRPAECGEPGGRGANAWERAKSPDLGRYCDLLASASSKLAASRPMAQAALESAGEAERVLPGHAAPRVLAGRALAALGKLAEAREALREARAREPGALDDPRALLAWARVLARSGSGREAVDAYRDLLPRASGLAPADRAAATIEAGLVTMSQGPPALDDAVGALREGLRDAQDEVQLVAVLGLALALDRRGDREESRALLAARMRGDPRVALSSARVADLAAVAPPERLAMAAVGLEPSDPAGAREAWEKYLAAADGGAWAAHARAHLASLGAPRRRAR